MSEKTINPDSYHKRKKFKKFSWSTQFRRLVSLDGDPHRIALAFAIGTFISFTPFYGLHTAMALVVAYMFKLNLTALMIGAWLNNPLISLYVYSFCYWIGYQIIGGTTFNFAAENWQAIFRMSMSDFIVQISVGCMLLSMVSSVTAYWIAKRVILKKRKIPSVESKQFGS